jgi:GNAT superfamily N-acetyltransferase
MNQAREGSVSTEPFTRARVSVTFLAMHRPPEPPVPCLPDGVDFVRIRPCSVPFYRYLYSEVGGEYLWWMRRNEPDDRLAILLGHPQIAVHVLTINDEPAGIAELDFRPAITVNLAYFGLMKRAIGRGLGLPFLHAALDEAWSVRPRAVTVNTCTADHPRALPTYLRAGFVKLRTVEEDWDIPDRLGLNVPERLRVGRTP